MTYAKRRDSSEYREAARRAIGWCLQGQVPYSGKIGDVDANQGRCTMDAWEDGSVCLGASWVNAVYGMAMLAVHKVFGIDEYLSSACEAARYLKTLQALDSRTPECFGAFHEYIPQTPWVYPRDATTAAWFFLYLHQVTGEQDLLERADFYGKWLCRHGLDVEGWPMGMVVLDTGHPEETAPPIGFKLQPHTGNLTFLAWMHRLTGDGVYRDVAARIFELTLTDFQDESGVYHGEQEYGHHSGKRPGNDDFASIGMMSCELLLGFTGGIDSARRYADSLVQDQKSYSSPPHISAAPIAINLYLRLDEIDGSDLFRPWAERFAEYLMAVQEPPCSPIHIAGAFHTMDRKNEKSGKTIRGYCARTTCYAVPALLLLAGEKTRIFGSPAVP